MSNTLKTIVIGTALTDTSDDVVRTGIAIAKTTGATPWLINVHSLPDSPAEIFGAVDGGWIDEYEKALRDKLAQQAQRTGLTGLPGFVPHQLYSAMGSTYGEIVELAQRVRADLIVIGASEGGALHRLFLGSTADGVVRKAPCPVLVVRSGSTFPPARVEFPVDLSPLSASAFRQGLEFLAGLGGGAMETETLFILNPLEVSGSLHFTPDQVERFALDELRRFLVANGARPETAKVRTGYPWEEILAVLEERRPDLVILGTHGRKGFERLMLGSVASAVMHRATCNLLIVPPGARLQQEAEQELRRERVGADWSFVSDEAAAAAAAH